MRIEELLPDQKVTLQVNVNGNELSFDTRVQEANPKKHFILLDAVMQGSKGISFKGPNIVVNLFVCLDGERPYLFQSVTALLQKKPDGTLCYLVTASTEGLPFNRREHFRCYVGTQGHLNHSSLDGPQTVIVRDVSYSGFSVVCNPEIALKEGQVIHVILRDEIVETNESFSFHLYGLIVRTEELPNGSILYGCKLNNHVAGLDQYIMTKERYRLKKASGH